MTPLYGLWLLGQWVKGQTIAAVAIVALGPVYVALSAIAAMERRP